MIKLSAEVLDYYDEEIVKMISEKYGWKPMESLRRFLKSETYKMLTNAELAMWEFGPEAILDMWENEQISGNPRNSAYLRRDEDV